MSKITGQQWPGRGNLERQKPEVAIQRSFINISGVRRKITSLIHPSYLKEPKVSSESKEKSMQPVSGDSAEKPQIEVTLVTETLVFDEYLQIKPLPEAEDCIVEYPRGYDHAEFERYIQKVLPAH